MHMMRILVIYRRQIINFYNFSQSRYLLIDNIDSHFLKRLKKESNTFNLFHYIFIIQFEFSVITHPSNSKNFLKY